MPLFVSSVSSSAACAFAAARSDAATARKIERSKNSEYNLIGHGPHNILVMGLIVATLDGERNQQDGAALTHSRLKPLPQC
jgi:hypothetical protein